MADINDGGRGCASATLPGRRTSRRHQQDQARIELLKRLSTVELDINDLPQLGEPLVLTSPTCQITQGVRRVREPVRGVELRTPTAETHRTDPRPRQSLSAPRIHHDDRVRLEFQANAKEPPPGEEGEPQRDGSGDARGARGMRVRAGEHAQPDGQRPARWADSQHIAHEPAGPADPPHTHNAVWGIIHV